MTEKFLGCIISIKTKVNQLTGGVQNIIGTVREISLSPTALILDDAMSNGQVLPDGYVVYSTTISDLQVIGKSTLPRKPDNFVKNDLNYSPSTTDGGASDESDADSADDEGIEEEVVVARELPHHKIAKPKPRKFGQEVAPFEKLGVLRCFLGSINPPAVAPPQAPPQKPSNKQTFQKINMSELSQEFDFEQNNSLFAKLPVTTKPPSQPSSLPHFTPHDTTFTSERLVPSTTLKNVIKYFVTDTGVGVPGVDLTSRSRILNLANSMGLPHGKMIETMATAVVQLVVPLLGNSSRLSPERCDGDRPWVLVLGGPHWQGAVGIATGRMLSTLGVHVVVYSPKEELTVVAMEEKLYKLCGEAFTRVESEIPPLTYDVIIHSSHDHLTPQFNLHTPHSSPHVVYIDPPLTPTTYKTPNRKTTIISPLLPLAYKIENGVKHYVVNVGVPAGVFSKEGANFKSFFGGKLAIQIFDLKKK
ncbi:enhancer of mRNA-decapping protein 3-like [Folsomia candida]|uniref:enhancer of mRNA-decapping protein 3-like n=1 Tax=Folsomia candida TaxID=158441 RepID=UPI000B8F923A|nr:enhancer of mRNA-decapping protein 3-like [Folsomia candida]